MNWSDELQDKMSLLTPAQRRGILVIVMGEVKGISLTRLLKTTYSCPHCGYVAGRSGEVVAKRREGLEGHIKECDMSGEQWAFATSAANFYGRWKLSSYFGGCLEDARREVASSALDEAARILQIGTPDAARELRAQILGGEKAVDRRASSVAVLDRAALGTAAKSDDGMNRWLRELRGVEDEEALADPGSEADDLSDVGASSESKPGEDTQ